MKKLFFFPLLLISIFAFAQDAPVDAEGCIDHPLFNRLPDFYINQCTQNYAALDVMMNIEKMDQQEGTLTHIDYLFNRESQHKTPSWLQITKNYENAILKSGGKKIYSDGERASYKMNNDGKEIWVVVILLSGESLSVDEFTLDVLEKEPMKQEIQSSAIFEEINKSGHVALYINFETGRAEIKSESQSTIEQVAQMLKDNPDLKVSIEGHTDNTGSTQENKLLSEKRAMSVLNALTAKGIDNSRLSSKGWGEEKPIADNATEEGKAKNRRVEIVRN